MFDAMSGDLTWECRPRSSMGSCITLRRDCVQSNSLSCAEGGREVQREPLQPSVTGW